MKLSRDDFYQAMTTMRNFLKTEVQEAVKQEMDIYRKGVWTSDPDFCCVTMKEFVESLNQTSNYIEPVPDRTPLVLQIRGHIINFCPFCGAPSNHDRIKAEEVSPEVVRPAQTERVAHRRRLRGRVR